MDGGDHAGGAGGYCGGCGQSTLERTDNGFSCKMKINYGCGGSYFEKGTLSGTLEEIQVDIAFSNIGGQGSKTMSHQSRAGDGGIAGKGGVISVSQSAIVNAFNGNKYTDGTDYESGKNQLEIFAQKGDLRDIYKYSLYFDTKTYRYGNEEYKYNNFFKMLFKETVSKQIDEFKEYNVLPVHNYLVRPAVICNLSGYTNSITNNTQGVGSGAGYIELDNGSYTVDPSLN